MACRPRGSARCRTSLGPRTQDGRSRAGRGGEFAGARGRPHGDRAGSASWAAEPPNAPPPAPGAQWDPVLGLGHRGQRDWCSFHPGRPLAQSQPWVTWCQIPHTKHQPSTDISHDQCPPGPPAPPKLPRPAPGPGLACACTKTSKESTTMHQPARRWAAGEGCRESNGAGGSATSLREGWAACCPGAAHRPPGGRTQKAVETGRRTAAGCRQDAVRHTGPGHRAENEHRAGSYLLPMPTDRPGARCREGSEHQKDRAASPASDAREAGRCHTRLPLSCLLTLDVLHFGEGSWVHNGTTSNDQSWSSSLQEVTLRAGMWQNPTRVSEPLAPSTAHTSTREVSALQSRSPMTAGS